ncbi:hypothetical protein IMZ48_00385, partial [Candidatus Bathyarchaeota archaeon]|nr:hypothetical protein [Candidatus Bathyarchaeota archaeon]
MSAHSSIPAPFLRLPIEVCQEIFTTVFQSTTIRSNRFRRRYRSFEDSHDLAILSVCRRFYHEASPLAIPNVHIFCDSNAALVETLSKMSTAQITQLRHVIIEFIPIGFNLFQEAKSSQEDSTDCDIQDDHRGRKWGYEEGVIPDYVRHFHLGAILGLFPGLQLDLLEVCCGTTGTSDTPDQVIDCLGSLLEADGYRQLWMEAADADAEWTQGQPQSPERWKVAFDSKFKPHGGEVIFKLRDFEWEY